MSTAFSKSKPAAAVLSDRATPDLGFDKPERFCELLAEIRPIALTGERLLAAEALRLLMQLDKELLEARAHWNQDWFRRVMRIRPGAVLRLRRRLAKIDPTPAMPLGSLRRRYHANLAGYLYKSRQ